MRLIDADALTDELAVIAYTHDCLGMLEAINSAPTIEAVEVVRCKDCIYWKQTGVPEVGLCISAQWRIYKEFGVKATDTWDYDYCSYGVRKE